MADDLLTLRGFYSELNKDIRAAGSASQFARDCGVSPQAVLNVQNTNRRGSDELLGKMGWERVGRYRRKRTPSA
ncbi:hypothetical protein HLH34_04345 [Gluconacetobacter azotocaptans]|uniref:Uncharacterized protein n=1 Tax=Gluconacetobacter azotocaptans TaxID=142834 RepID=A0A7W4PE90_9PROT|nr:hypothetical protein [Gluconacetobacter azotocaptans]MBB2189194.1 hypothetical protein [Gluconacetobacter azotocaptans]GBQ32209.1 hypothetical protein AA13594_2302 [Gluconacetobacter azotocaptans DSM 13594]